jgi:long-chain acyl-CoA synthetase
MKDQDAPPADSLIVWYPNHVDPESPRYPGRVIARLARQVELALTAVDLSLPQYRVLILLAEGNEAASALAEKLAVSRPSVTGVVDGLVARGLVGRITVPDDRRRVDHDLTDAGRRLLERAESEVQQRLAEIVAHRPERADEAFAGLAPWQEALDSRRSARLAARRQHTDQAVAAAARGLVENAAGER